MTDNEARVEAIALLPCPFCDGKAEFERIGTARQSTIVACNECGCRLETGEEFNHGGQWNTRTATRQLAELQAEILGRKGREEAYQAIIAKQEKLLAECALVLEGWQSERRIADLLTRIGEQHG